MQQQRVGPQGGPHVRGLGGAAHRGAGYEPGPVVDGVTVWVPVTG